MELNVLISKSTATRCSGITLKSPKLVRLSKLESHQGLLPGPIAPTVEPHSLRIPYLQIHLLYKITDSPKTDTGGTLIVICGMCKAGKN